MRWIRASWWWIVTTTSSQHNQAALRLLDTDVLTHMNQVKEKLKDEHLAKHETQAMLKDKHVRIIALSDVSHELSNQEVDLGSS